jgi:CTP synthase
MEAARYAREQGIPYLGICFGLHAAAVDFARHVCGLERANSAEIDAATPHAVIDFLPDQRNQKQMGGTMRLGGYTCHLVPGTRSAEAYATDTVLERHRHRYEFNNEYLDTFESHGMKVAGRSDTGLVEILEIPGHPWYVAVQFHPEFRSRPGRAHPLFREFIAAAIEHAAGGDEPGNGEGESRSRDVTLLNSAVL